MILGQVIRSIRIRKGLTQEEVCIQAGITQGFYSGIEHGRQFSLEMLQKIAEVLNVPACLIIFSATEYTDVNRRDYAWLNRLKPEIQLIIDEISSDH